MNWSAWRAGLLVSALTGITTGVLGLVAGITWRQALFIVGLSVAKDMGLYLKAHPVDQPPAPANPMPFDPKPAGQNDLEKTK